MKETNESQTDESVMDTQIQRLIDGALEEEQRLSLLQQIDRESPESWRDVALGYIEGEVLRSAFREEEAELEQKVTPFPVDQRKSSGFHLAAIAALAMILGAVLGSSIQSSLVAPEPTIPVAEKITIQQEAPVSPSIQAIESLDLALRDRGLEPVISKAVYRAELPDGRRLILPVQRLSFQPE